MSNGSFVLFLGDMQAKFSNWRANFAMNSEGPTSAANRMPEKKGEGRAKQPGMA